MSRPLGNFQKHLRLQYFRFMVWYHKPNWFAISTDEWCVFCSGQLMVRMRFVGKWTIYRDMERFLGLVNVVEIEVHPLRDDGCIADHRVDKGQKYQG